MDARATNLRTEYLADPLGIDETVPRFSWWIDDARPGARQTAYRVRVASSPALLATDGPDLWDSGRIEGDRQTQVAYAGAALGSRAQGHWDVTVWDADGAAEAVSAAAAFEVGLLDRAEWSAAWVTTAVEASGTALPPAPILRRTFRVERPARRARPYITALGLYEAPLSGRRVSDDYFRAGWTDYRLRLQYQTYDVTELIATGENALAVLLGDGWYSGWVAQLEIAHDDGTATRIVTDDGWRWREGPIRGQDLIERTIHLWTRVVGTRHLPQER